MGCYELIENGHHLLQMVMRLLWLVISLLRMARYSFEITRLQYVYE